MTYHYMHNSWPVLELRATDHRESFAGNTHRVVIARETKTEYFGWPDPTDKRNSEHWKPGIDRVLQYPKFAWEVLS